MPYNGKELWRAEVPGAAFVTNGEDPLLGGPGAAPPVENGDQMTPRLFAVGGHTVVPISPGDGVAARPFDGVPGPARVPGPSPTPSTWQPCRPRSGANNCPHDA